MTNNLNVIWWNSLGFLVQSLHWKIFGQTPRWFSLHYFVCCFWLVLLSGRCSLCNTKIADSNCNIKMTQDPRLIIVIVSIIFCKCAHHSFTFTISSSWVYKSCVFVLSLTPWTRLKSCAHTFVPVHRPFKASERIYVMPGTSSSELCARDLPKTQPVAVDIRPHHCSQRQGEKTVSDKVIKNPASWREKFYVIQWAPLWHFQSHNGEMSSREFVSHSFKACHFSHFIFFHWKLPQRLNRDLNMNLHALLR